MAKHYAISDIHGMHDIYDQVCEILQPEDIVYFLGDAGDRGYANWQTIKDIYNNPQWIYLKGNHEDMMAKSLKEIQRKFLTGSEEHDLWMFNGGFDTKNGWMQDGADISWYHKLCNLPLIAKYTNKMGFTFHMSHAGFTCGRQEEMREDELVWSRSHFFDHWDEEQFKHDICIHGHTPLEYLEEEMNWHGKYDWKWEMSSPEAHVYCNEHKINIDNGVFYTGGTVLYDLDEMKAIQLFDRKFNETVES